MQTFTCRHSLWLPSARQPQTRVAQSLLYHGSKNRFHYWRRLSGGRAHGDLQNGNAEQRNRTVSVVASAASDTSSAVQLASVEAEGKEVAFPLGRLLLRPLMESDIKAATVVLTRAFAATGYLQLDNIGQYCSDMLMQRPHSLLLVARLYTEDASQLPEGQDSRLIGTVALSFNRNTREEFPSLQPPDDAAYLSNMAICPGFRRQGVARILLSACEEVCAARGFQYIYLHARLGDEAAIQLYESSGYEHVDRDSYLVKLRGITPRSLMRKAIAPTAMQ